MSGKKEIDGQKADSKRPRHPLEAKLGYCFKATHLLEEALTHPTYAHEFPHQALQDNQRLEFLGDAVLNLVVGHLLMKHYPNAREGELTRMRSHLVSETSLAGIARGLELGAHIQLGKGERSTHGQNKCSILADALEALMAALYLDGGEKVFETIEILFTPLLGAAHTDPKTDLQELVQKQYRVMPQYRVISATGPDHDKTFVVQLSVLDVVTTGRGKSKKIAEKRAAEDALKLLSDLVP